MLILSGGLINQEVSPLIAAEAVSRSRSTKFFTATNDCTTLTVCAMSAPFIGASLFLLFRSKTGKLLDRSLLLSSFGAGLFVTLNLAEPL